MGSAGVPEYKGTEGCPLLPSPPRWTPYIPKHNPMIISRGRAGWPLCPLPGWVGRGQEHPQTPPKPRGLTRGCDPTCSLSPHHVHAKVPRGRPYSPDQRAEREAGDQGQGPPVLLHLLLLLPPARRRHILPAAATAEAKMEEQPEQEREDGTERPEGWGARGAAPPRLASRPASPRGPGQRGQGRFTGALRGLPPPPLGPPARPRPPPPAVAATASPSPPRPLEPSLRAASDQRPPRTRHSTANRRPGPDTSHAAELEGDASPTSRSARTPARPRRGPRPLR